MSKMVLDTNSMELKELCYIYLLQSQDQPPVLTFPPNVVEALEKHLSREEVSELTVKADALIADRRFREGFQDGAYFVDSGGSSPHKVICYKSGKTTCSCSFVGRNNLCSHALAVAKHKNRLPGLLKHYPGRNLNTLATNTAPKGVGGKAPPRKKKSTATDALPTCSSAEDNSEHLSVEQVDTTKIVICRNERPSDPPITAPLVVKKIAGGIRKCVACKKDIKSAVIGFNHEQDSHYCLARYEAYYFWNKHAGCYKLTSSTRHFHINPVCTIVPAKRSLWELIKCLKGFWTC